MEFLLINVEISHLVVQVMTQGEKCDSKSYSMIIFLKRWSTWFGRYDVNTMPATTNIDSLTIHNLGGIYNLGLLYYSISVYSLNKLKNTR